MNNDDFNTYKLADINARFFALCIDHILILILSGILGFGSLIFGGSLFLVITIAYHWYFLTRRDGVTPGKSLMKIRVISTDGEPIRDIDAILRTLGYSLNTAFGGILWLWALWDDQRQGIHDKLGRTLVVVDEPATEAVYISTKQKHY